MHAPTNPLPLGALAPTAPAKSAPMSCIAVELHLCGPLQYSTAIQIFLYNLQKTCRLLATVVKKLYCSCIVLVWMLQYNTIFVLCYCSCIALGFSIYNFGNNKDISTVLNTEITKTMLNLMFKKSPYLLEKRN